MSKYIGKRIVPKHCGEWKKETAYEMLSIVLDKENGDSYISRCEVPAGVELRDAKYWALCSDFSQQIQDMSGQLSETESRMAEDLSETKAAMSEELEQAQQLMLEQTEDAKIKVDEATSIMSEAIEAVNKRLDANVSASTDASADYAAELVDARVDSYGNTYPSLGSRLRNRENVFVCDKMTGLYIDLKNGWAVSGHESYKGYCTTRIKYDRSFGNIQIEKKNLVFANGYIATIGFYDVDGNYLGGLNQESDFVIDERFAALPVSSVPDSAASFSVSLNSSGNTVMIRYSNADWYWIANALDEMMHSKGMERVLEITELMEQTGSGISCTKNLLDTESPYVIHGKYLGKDGKINESDLYAISNYIPVRAGTEYTYNSSTGGAYCTIYDAGFQAVGDFKGNSSLTIPENGCYVRLSFPYSSTDAMFYEKSQDDGLYDKYCSLYSFYKQYVQDKVNLETSLSLKLDKVLTKNLFNKDSENIIRERYLGSSGNIATNTMYFVSDFIPVEPGETYYPYNFGAGGAYHCVYAEDQRTVVLAFKDTAVTIPETGRYVRLSGVLSRLDSQQFEKGNSFTGYEPYAEYLPALEIKKMVEALEEEVKDPVAVKNKLDKQVGKNLFHCKSQDNLMGKYLGGTGAVNTSADYYISHYIPVSEGITYHLQDFGEGGAFHCVYADDRSFLLSFKGSTVTIPEGGSYVRLSGRIASMETQQFEEGDEFTGYEEYTDYSPCYENKKAIQKLESDLADAVGNAITVILPETLYFCVGSPLSLYYENILYKSLADSADLYCSKAQPYSRLMNFSFDTAENGELEMVICRGLKKVSHQKFRYEAVDPAVLSGKVLHLLFIGDSFTDIGTYVTESRNLLASQGAEVDLIGTCGSSKFRAEGLSGGSLANTFLNTSAGAARIVQVHGVSTAPNTGYPGRTYQDDNGNQWTIRGSKLDAEGNGKLVVTKFAATEEMFQSFPESGTLTKVSTGGEGDEVIPYEGAKPAYHNPFINPETGATDILYYLREWEFEAPDVVVFQFTWNDAGEWITDYSRLVSNFTQAVDHVHENLPDAKVILSIEPFGSIHSGRDWNGKKYTVLNLVRNLREVFEADAYRNFCKIAPSYACVDLVYGYSTAKVTPNDRYPDQMEISAGDGVHPGTGMLQIADCLYPVITKLVSDASIE